MRGQLDILTANRTSRAPGPVSHRQLQFEIKNILETFRTPSERARPALYYLSLRVSYAVIKWWMSNDDRSGHILASLLLLPANNTSYITPELVKLQTGHTEWHSLLLLETINPVQSGRQHCVLPMIWKFTKLPDVDWCVRPVTALVTEISDQSRMKLYVRLCEYLWLIWRQQWCPFHYYEPQMCPLWKFLFPHWSRPAPAPQMITRTTLTTNYQEPIGPSEL